MNKLTIVPLLVFAALLVAPRSFAQSCCAFETVSCEFMEHEDARCSAGTRSSASVEYIWACPQANQIVLNGDPLAFFISFLIASENARVYCEEQTSSVCSNPNAHLCGDTDEDGLWDIWERHGLDGDGNGEVETFLPDADWQRKDLFVEIDCLESDGNGDGDYDDTTDHSHCPRRDALELVVQTYADAPVLNWDGTSGIQLHIDVGDLFGAGTGIAVAGAGGVVGSYGDLGGGGDVLDEAGLEVISLATVADLKDDYFDGNRRRAFRYGIYGHSIVTPCTSGVAESPGNDFIVSLGGLRPPANPMDPWVPCWGTDANGFSVGSTPEQAGLFMHEFGHTLGRQHGGEQRSNNKPNYLSTMTHLRSTCRVPASPLGLAVAPGGCDYSAIELPPLDESSLDECAGIDGGLLGFGIFDWNNDGVHQGATCPAPNTTNVAADVNGELLCVSDGPNKKVDSTSGGDDAVGGGAVSPGANGVCETTPSGDDVSDIPLRSYEDWNHLQLALGTTREFADGATPPEDEPTPDSIEAQRQYVSARTRPDVLVQTSAPATALPGTVINYEIRLSNDGYGPALNVAATLLAPDGGGTTTALGALVLGDSRDLTAAYAVAADACPMTLTQSTIVEYEDFAGYALASSGAAVTTVLDVVPPTLHVVGSGNVTLECGLDVYTELGAVATDSCDPDVPVSIGGDTVETDHPGSYSVTYSAEDDSGNRSSLDRVVLVADTTPPSLAVSLSPNTLSPPNHKLVEVVPTITVSDACDPSPVVSLVGISSNEPVNGTGDGNTSSDIVIDAQGKIFLRAERAGTGSGRVYALTFQAIDAANNVQIFSTNVVVPKN